MGNPLVEVIFGDFSCLNECNPFFPFTQVIICSREINARNSIPDIVSHILPSVYWLHSAWALGASFFAAVVKLAIMSTRILTSCPVNMTYHCGLYTSYSTFILIPHACATISTWHSKPNQLRGCRHWRVDVSLCRAMSITCWEEHQQEWLLSYFMCFLKASGNHCEKQDAGQDGLWVWTSRSQLLTLFCMLKSLPGTLTIT